MGFGSRERVTESENVFKTLNYGFSGQRRTKSNALFQLKTQGGPMTLKVTLDPPEFESAVLNVVLGDIRGV